MVCAVGILRLMPVYEYRCRTCGDTFERLRPRDDADAPADCTCGAGDTVRLLSMVAPTARGGVDLGGAPAGGGGGCCGGACGCGH